MKSCPTCKKTFTDQYLSYCVDDGTPLVSVADDEDELTEVGSANPNSRTPPAYQPPNYDSQGGEKRKTWPWIVGIFGVLALVLIGVSIAAVIFVPRILKKSRESVVVSNSNTNNSVNQNSNSANENTAETNTNAKEVVNTPPPTDKEAVLTQLRDLEHEWTVANLNADKKKLGQILADDYVSPRADGKMQGKAEYISTIQRDTTVQKWDFRDLKLTLRDDRATLFGKVSFQQQGRELLFDFVDRFVWRDGRWQATGSEVTPVKE